MRTYADVIVRRFIEQDPDVTCRNITFQVTDDCCLNCSYCYQINKGHRMMSVETAKEIIDLLFRMYDENKENNFINKHTHGIILDFIGGEPFMNVTTMSAATEYFINTCVKKNHEWLENFRISISTNGMMYFEPEVQRYLQQYKEFISMSITLDGPKILHDSCRVDFNKEGSFDRVYKSWKHWKDQQGHVGTKITIAPENLPYLDEIFEFFINEGCDEINANPIYEHEWTVEEAQLYYKQLIKLADILLKNRNVVSTLFDVGCGQPMMSTNNSNWCGGTAAMLAYDPDGIAYPCLRYMESSLGTSRPPIIIGNTKDIYYTEEQKQLCKKMQNITRRSQSTDECFNCHIAEGCAWCSAWNYQETGDINKRSTNICWMHRARTLANVYYWNMFYQLYGPLVMKPLYLERSIATKIITNEEYDKLFSLTMGRR